ncbi:MAG TPA: LytTR family DNA-binding domain-containing protein [Burkholderiaceae bacterium]|nr:LytTR family DNA-binding domain-containing protein [Burkholderiaceae bacterium]
MTARALIAEDEPLLAANLQAELERLWPGLEIAANVRHGAAAVESALALRPDVVFLDIRMPGLSGLEAAQALAEDWPDGAGPLPAIVFVTAYDQYALQAFEHSAVDYVLKPVQPDRLAQTCGRVQAALKARQPNGPVPDPAAALEATLGQLRHLLAAPGLASGAAAAAAPRLSVVQASVGNAIHMVPVGDVLYFEAADKYVRVITAEREYLIRTALRELIPQLDETRFWQVHRGLVVRADAIATAVRDETGKVHLSLRGHKDKLVASRLYAHLFKAM